MKHRFGYGFMAGALCVWAESHILQGKLWSAAFELLFAAGLYALSRLAGA